MSSSNSCPYPAEMPCQVWAGSIPHNCLLFSAMAAFTPVGSVPWSKEGWIGFPVWVGLMLGWSWCNCVPDCTWHVASMNTSNVCPWPMRILWEFWTGSILHNCALSSAWQPAPWCGNVQCGKDCSGHPVWTGAHVGMVTGNWLQFSEVSISFPHIVLEVSKHVHTLHE